MEIDLPRDTPLPPWKPGAPIPGEPRPFGAAGGDLLLPGEVGTDKPEAPIEFPGDDPDEEDDIGLLDDLFESGEAVPPAHLFDTPMQLPKPEDLDDAQLEAVFKDVLRQLARANITLDMCEHFTQRRAYTLLLDEILWNGQTYARLRGSEWVTRYMTAEWCPECEAQVMRDYESLPKPNSGGDDDDDLPF